jgi:hypothetical protein
MTRSKNLSKKKFVLLKMAWLRVGLVESMTSMRCVRFDKASGAGFVEMVVDDALGDRCSFGGDPGSRPSGVCS